MCLVSSEASGPLGPHPVLIFKEVGSWRDGSAATVALTDDPGLLSDLCCLNLPDELAAQRG